MSLRRQPSRVTTPSSKKVIPSLFINPNIESFLQQFSQFVRRHIVENKSETVLIAGPPSCGKSKLLENIFNKIKIEENNLSERLIIIRLNGLIHAIETAALQEIASQFDKSDLICDNLQMLLETMATERTSKIYFIFVLDHFEQFTYQKLNSILYTLFDAVYSDKKSYSILTIAVSNRADCLELPEKRLKSRFSQIYYILAAPPIDEFAQHVLDRFGATTKMKKEIQINDGIFNSLANVEQTIIRRLRDPESNVQYNDENRPDQQLDGCLTHLELLLLLMANNVVKRIDDKLQNRMTGNESDDDENDEENDGTGGGIMSDTRFTFDQIYHEYAKYVLKNHKYFYDKAVVRKVSLRFLTRTCVFLMNHE